MREKINLVIKHPLISGSAVIIIGSMVGNIFNYLYNLGMGRLLSVSEYGILASLISVYNIFIVCSTTLVTVFSKFSASFVGKNQEHLIGGLFKKGTIFVGIVGLIFSAFIIIISFKLTVFLKIKEPILIDIVALSVFFSFMASVTSGVLQGLLKFFRFSVVYTASSLLKFIFGLIFVLFGFRIFGATTAILLSSVSAYVLGFLLLRVYIKNKNSDNHLSLSNINRELSKYAFPVLLSNLGLTLIYMMDIILVKHFFSEVAAGQYAALSLMGRSIFFVVLPITSVFFPIVAQKKERNEKLLKIVIASAALIGLPSLILLGVYFILPKLVLLVFFPAKEYLILSSYLGPFAIFILFYTFSNFLVNYYLSIGKTKVYILTLLAAAVEVFLIIFFHDTIYQVVSVLITISFLLLISLLLYYPHAHSEKE